MQTSPLPFLVSLSDKALLFDGDRKGFLMYGVKGRTWVALGDPVGPPECVPRLIRIFLERCRDFDATPVFYRVQKQNLHHYADFGLTVVTLGEAARVDLTRFTMEGGDALRLPHVMRRLEQDGATFRLVAEKDLSMGLFDKGYLRRFPVAVIERGGTIAAFASVWPGPDHDEVSADLIRLDRSAPPNVMDALFLHLLLWAKNAGYRWFSLGMAPISDRFHLEWAPNYLAYPKGLKLPRVLEDVAALVTGGYKNILFRPSASRRLRPAKPAAPAAFWSTDNRSHPPSTR